MDTTCEMTPEEQPFSTIVCLNVQELCKFLTPWQVLINRHTNCNTLGQLLSPSLPNIHPMQHLQVFKGDL